MFVIYIRSQNKNLTKYHSGDKIKEDNRDAYGVLVGKPVGRRAFGRARHRWVIILKCISEKRNGARGMDGVDLAQDRDRCWAVANAVMNLLVP